MLSALMVGGLGNAHFAPFSDQTELLSVESDAIAGTFHLLVERDANGEMTSLINVNPEGTTNVFTLEKLRSGPQLIRRLEGRDVVFVSVENDFSSARGGHARMRYLKNGLLGNYKNFRMVIEPQGAKVIARGDADPRDPDSDGSTYSTVFNYLFLKKNTLLGKTIGVEEVIPEQK